MVDKMWNFMNVVGHNGHFMDAHSNQNMNQKRDFGFRLTNIPILPGKSFSNPNFVNKHHPYIHNYQHDFISSIAENKHHGDNCNSDIKNTNSFLENSSQSILDTIKEKHFKIINDTDTHCEKLPSMCNRKRTNRSRKTPRNKVPHKNSKQNVNKNLINDIMEVDLEVDMERENFDDTFDISMSPKSPKAIILTDFIMPPDLMQNCNSVCGVTDENAVKVIPISPSNSDKSCSRERQLSTTESEDSFIVFKSGTDEELLFSDESDSEEDTDSNIEDDFDSSSSVIPYKRVRFAENDDLCVVHPMVQWSYAYQQARRGPWEEYARDRDRFQNRINNVEKILAPILDVRHRENIYKTRFDLNGD